MGQELSLPNKLTNIREKVKGMKKRVILLSYILALSMLMLTGCVSSSGQHQDDQVTASNSTQNEASLSQTADPGTQGADPSAQGTDLPLETGTEGTPAPAASVADEKLALVVLGEEEDNFDRAVSTRSGKKTTDPNAYILRPFVGDASVTAADTDANTVVQPPLPTTPKAKEYTIMVYIVGSNLESRLGAATSDIEEMRDAGLDFERANLLLYTGGSRRWVSDIPNDTNNVLDLSRGEGVRITAQTSRSANMGEAQTLAEFINYCTRNYPAEHYALILWDPWGRPAVGIRQR